MENLYLEMKPLYEQVLEYLVIYIYTHLHIIYTYLHNIYTISTNIGARLCPAPSAPSLRAQSGGQVSRYLHCTYKYLRISTVDRAGLIPVHLLGHYGAGWWTPLDNDRQWHFWSKLSFFTLPLFYLFAFSLSDFVLIDVLYNIYASS